MADGSTIEWLQLPGYKGATWNPTRGCARQGDGCAKCWAIGQARRQDTPGGKYEGLTTIRNGHVDWMGVARPAPEMLDRPLHWRDPRCIFVESMGDLFHPGIPFEYIAACFGVIAATPQHVHIILTKQPKRARAFFEWIDAQRDGEEWESVLARWYEVNATHSSKPLPDRRATLAWPLPNVWLLVSAWDQPSLEKYLPDLLACPSVVRGLSLEPLLGPVRADDVHDGAGGVFKPLVGLHWVPTARGMELRPASKGPTIDWVIVGGESGNGARPMQPDWVRAVGIQCAAASTPFFFKQWGNNAPNAAGELVRLRTKKQGGRLLDGREWNEFPRVG